MIWLRLRIGGQRWRVHLVSPRSKFLDDDGTRRVGSCHFDRCAIYVSRDLDAAAREDTLLHELLHALLYVSGADEHYGKSARVEERIVGALTPHLHRLLVDLGMRFPA